MASCQLQLWETSACRRFDSSTFVRKQIYYSCLRETRVLLILWETDENSLTCLYSLVPFCISFFYKHKHDLDSNMLIWACFTRLFSGFISFKATKVKFNLTFYSSRQHDSWLNLSVRSQRSEVMLPWFNLISGRDFWRLTTCVTKRTHGFLHEGCMCPLFLSSWLSLRQCFSLWVFISGPRCGLARSVDIFLCEITKKKHNSRHMHLESLMTVSSQGALKKRTKEAKEEEGNEVSV